MEMDIQQEQVINVLLVDDDCGDCRLIEHALSPSASPVRFDLDIVHSMAEAVEQMAQKHHDIALLDLGLPDSNGIDTVTRARRENSEIPIIVLTGLADEKMALSAIQNGAEDYVVKGKSFGEALVRIIRYTVERKGYERNLTRLLRELEQTNKELNDFASIVSHDLKAPLRGIHTIVDWIMADNADKLDEEGKEQMQLLIDRVERMNNLIDGVLKYSRVGQKKEKKVLVDINLLICEVQQMLVVDEHITVSVEGQLPTLYCEATRLAQVFSNLLSNAIQHMDKPDGKIRIGCIEDGRFWRFSVADNGPGIEQRYFERIFQIFQTLPKSSDFESTGVGLTIVRKIVEMYGGRVWVESEVGQGSTFYFTFPKQQRVPDETAQKPCAMGTL